MLEEVPILSEIPSFLAGGGEMGALLRAHDWSHSPLGPSETWPQPLRVAIGIVLASKLPACLVWGPQLVTLYNDAFRPILGAKPEALGRPFNEVWAEAWSEIGPLADRAFAGEATFIEDFPLVVERHGYPEQAYFTFCYSPVRDETNAVVGFLDTVVETTAHVLAARRRDALLKLDERLRDVADTASLSFAASEVVGEALGASRVGYGSVDPDARTILVERNWFAPGYNNLAGVHHFADYGSYIEDLRQGLAVANADVEADSRTAAHAGAFRALGIRAHLDVPVVENGQTVGQMFVHSPVPRVWTDDEVALVRDCAERTRIAIARRAAQASLRESEARFRALAMVGSAAIYRMSPDWGELLRLDGAGFLVDTHAPTTNWIDAYIPPEERPSVRQAIARAISAGGAFELEHRVLRSDGTIGWAFSRAIPLFDNSGEIVEWFGAASDVTARVKADQSFTRLFQASPAPFLVLAPDAPRFTITEVNDAYLTATMRTRADLVGRPLFDAFPDNPEDATITGVSRLRASLDRVLASRQPDALPDLKYDIARPDGTFEERWWSPVNSPVLDENGEVEAVVHNANDVTEERRIEAALRESERELRFILKAGRLGAWSFDIITGDLTTSATCRANFGRHPDKPFSYAELRAAIHSDDQTRMAAAVEESLATRADYDIEYRVVTPGHEIRWVLIRAQPTYGLDGAPSKLVGVSLDVTDRKRDETRKAALVQLSDAIRDIRDPDKLAYAASEILGRTLEVSLVGYATIDPETETLHVERDWNAAGVQSLAGVLRLRDYGSFVDSLKRGEFISISDVRQDNRSTAAAEALEGRSARSFVNVPVIERGHLSALLYVNHGEARDWAPDDLGLIKDVAARTRTAMERLRAEAELRDSEARLRELNANLEQRVSDRTAELNRTWRLSQDMLVVTEADGTLVAVNSAWTDVLGWTEHELVGTTFMKITHPDDLAGVLAEFESVFKTPLVAPYEYRMRHKSGQYRWIAWTAAFEDGRVFANGRDVTDRRVREAELAAAQEALRQSQKMEAMGQLTGGVAHDFNNLLTPIIGSLDMLQRKGLGGERERRLIAGAMQSADRAKTLVQRLLAFARRQPLQAIAVDVTQLVRSMAELVESTTGPQIKVVVDAADDLPPAKADPNQLEMALLNLSVNARDAMPEGGTLRISASTDLVGVGGSLGLSPGRYVRLSVADTGLGMDEATLARAVEPFFSTKGVGKGTGLGLSMVHGLASQLGGALTISSQRKLGTNVELWLPLSETVPEVPAAPDQADNIDTRGTALLVDDEQVVRMSTSDMLNDLGFEVIEAESAEEALRIFRSGKALDLILTDHLMPGMSGTELARAVQTLRPGMPILIVSGYAEDEGVAPDLPRLIKPFRKDELASSLANLIRVC